MIGGSEYLAQTSYDDVLPEDTKSIAEIPWFRRQAILAEANNYFAALEHYTWDRELFWGIIMDALSSRVWYNLIAVDYTDLYIGRSMVAAK